MDQKPQPNDQRSDVKNPNNEAHKADGDNRADQLNPNNQDARNEPCKFPVAPR